MIKYNERRIFMVFTEKFDKLCEYESCEKLSEYDIDLIYRLSYDMNSFIRALSAEILAKIPNERSKSILFMLANDKHCFVRTEAYDSLSAFSDKATAELLADKISSESDELALSYAVISFAQICRDTDMINMGTEFLTSIADKLTSERCTLCMYYAMYLLGEGEYLRKIYSILHSKDYRIVCMAVSLLSDIINSSNSKEIISEVSKIDNDTIAVQSSIKSFLEKYC